MQALDWYILCTFVDGITRNITKDKDLKDYEIPDKGKNKRSTTNDCIT